MEDKDRDPELLKTAFPEQRAGIVVHLVRCRRIIRKAARLGAEEEKRDCEMFSGRDDGEERFPDD